LLEDSQKLTLEAQNNLLKVLEEPPARSLLILTADKAESLLATVLSRCQIIRLANSQKLELEKNDLDLQEKLAGKILTASIGKRLNLASQIGTNREEILSFIHDQLLYWRTILLKNEYGKTSPKKNQLEKETVISLLKKPAKNLSGSGEKSFGKNGFRCAFNRLPPFEKIIPTNDQRSINR